MNLTNLHDNFSSHLCMNTFQAERACVIAFAGQKLQWRQPCCRRRCWRRRLWRLSRDSHLYISVAAIAKPTKHNRPRYTIWCLHCRALCHIKWKTAKYSSRSHFLGFNLWTPLKCKRSFSLVAHLRRFVEVCCVFNFPGRATLLQLEILHSWNEFCKQRYNR